MILYFLNMVRKYYSSGFSFRVVSLGSYHLKDILNLSLIGVYNPQRTLRSFRYRILKNITFRD